jgi:predicted GIY-YIG superfamily endonuclease
MYRLAFVYVVKCRISPGKFGYYVGTWRGPTVETRWSQHRRRNGSRFTVKYEPISFVKVGQFPSAEALRLEDKLTAYFIKKVGFRFARGGNHLNMRANCHQLSELRWWLPGRLLPFLERGQLGVPDPQVLSF